MSYNGSGTFQINTSGQPVVAGTVISSTAFNALTADLATGLSTAITKDGQTTTTARIPFAAGINSSLTTDSTNSTSGSIITAGGVGIAKALYVGTTANVAGAVTLQSTLGVTGVATFSAAPIYSSLTASSAVATDASKALVSVTNTGTGNNVLATSPTLVTPILGTPQSGTLTNATGLPLTTGVTGVLPEANGGTGTTTGYYGFKNRIINGAALVAQRGNVAAVNGTYTYGGADRIACSVNSLSSGTIQQLQSAAAGGVSGFCQAVQATTSGAGSVFFQTRVEDLNTLDLNSKAVTISCKVFQDTGSTLTATISLAKPTTTANTFSAQTTLSSSTASIPSSTLTTVTLTYTLGAAEASLGLAPTLSFALPSAVTGKYFTITDFQMELGSTATSFDYRPYGTELLLCQRYYEKSYNLASIAGASTNTAKGSLSVGAAFNSFLRWTQTYKVPKRGDATFMIYSTTGASGNVRLSNASDLAVTIEDSGENASAIYVTRSWSLGDFVWWQWTASSEL
jgi:hypothetical protein